VSSVRANVLDGKGDPPYRPRGGSSQAHFHYVWPTFTLNVTPGTPNIAVFAFVPLEPGRTLAVTDYFFGEEATEEEIREVIEFGNQVGLEDQGLVESIQRAAASGGLDEGRLLLSSEHLIQHFQRLVERALASE
jgi:phenylpropionate dioxygenase-like ring-hydroxylating dioxygenase large terminal subunit